MPSLPFICRAQPAGTARRGASAAPRRRALLPWPPCPDPSGRSAQGESTHGAPAPPPCSGLSGAFVGSAPGSLPQARLRAAAPARLTNGLRRLLPPLSLCRGRPCCVGAGVARMGLAAAPIARLCPPRPAHRTARRGLPVTRACTARRCGTLANRARLRLVARMSCIAAPLDPAAPALFRKGEV